MTTRREVAIGTWPTPERVIRVTVPARLVFDLGSMQRITTSVLERLGHPQCHSGFDIRFEIATQYRVDDKLNLHELVSGVVVTDG